jgi:hypothetical protein
LNVVLDYDLNKEKKQSKVIWEAVSACHSVHSSWEQYNIDRDIRAHWTGAPLVDKYGCGAGAAGVKPMNATYDKRAKIVEETNRKEVETLVDQAFTGLTESLVPYFDISEGGMKTPHLPSFLDNGKNQDIIRNSMEPQRERFQKAVQKYSNVYWAISIFPNLASMAGAKLAGCENLVEKGAPFAVVRSMKSSEFSMAESLYKTINQLQSAPDEMKEEEIQKITLADLPKDLTGENGPLGAAYRSCVASSLELQPLTRELSILGLLKQQQR